MATDAPAVPRVEETGLDRDDLANAADELGIDDIDALDDQSLFEQIGLMLGEISEDQLSKGAQDTAEDTTEEAQDTAEEAQDTAEDTAEEAQDTAEDTAEEAQDTAEDAAEQASDTAEDTAEQASDTAEDTAEQAKGTAEDTTEQAEEAAQDTAEEAQDTTEQAEEAAEDTTGDTAEESEEYRPEDDDRPGVATVLDLELGPVALDLLGLEIHLNRIHAVITANPDPNYAILGKLLAPLGSLVNSLGVDSATDKLTDALDSTLDALPSPDLGEEGEEGEDGEDEDEGLLSTLAKPFTAVGRMVKNIASNSADAAGEAKEAGTSGVGAVRNAAAGNTMRAIKDGKNAMSHASDAAKQTATLASDG